jgi:hypothetical protein
MCKRLFLSKFSPEVTSSVGSAKKFVGITSGFGGG